jgi:hypothetical protein
VRAPRRTLAIILLMPPLLAAGQAYRLAGDLSSELHACIDLGGMSCEKELEHFLRTAEVVKIEDIGEGITKPRRLTLRKDGRQCRAIFKTVDICSTDIHYTNRLEAVFTDRYVYEVAAYRIDRLLGIGLVPVTVLREINGEVGSVQHWIEDCMKMQQAAENDIQVTNADLLLQRLMLMYILDAMIYNIDRNFSNILVRPDKDDFFLIDHSRSFRIRKKLPSLKEERNIPVPDRVAHGLRELDLETLQSELHELLSRRQIRAIEKRRELLLTELGNRGVLPPAG